MPTIPFSACNHRVRPGSRRGNGGIRLPVLLLLLSVWCISSCTRHPAGVASFSKLRSDNTIEVRLRQSGCFHEAVHELSFRNTSQFSVSIAQLKLETIESGRFVILSNRVELGSLVLSGREVEGLDRLLKFYRTPMPSAFMTRVTCCLEKFGITYFGPPPIRASTSFESVSISQQRAGVTIATESFTDTPLQAHRPPNSTLFTDLIDRLNPPR